MKSLHLLSLTLTQTITGTNLHPAYTSRHVGGLRLGHRGGQRIHALGCSDRRCAHGICLLIEMNPN